MKAYRFSAASTPNYGAVSKIFYSTINQILSKGITPAQRILAMQCQMHATVNRNTKQQNTHTHIYKHIDGDLHVRMWICV